MKFTTTLEAVSSNKSKTTIKLSLSNSAARAFTANFLNSIDKELIVEISDPQMEMELQPAPGGRPGLVATINGHGEVESVTRENPGDEDEDVESVLVQDDEGDEGDVFVPDDAADGLEEIDFADSYDSAEEEGEEPVDIDSAESSGQESSADQIDADELESYILSVRPMWDDIPFDFPALIARKKSEGLKWHEIAREYNIPSGTLQAAYGKYKKRCKDQMVNGAA